jgi:hypothetical protein
MSQVTCFFCGETIDPEWLRIHHNPEGFEPTCQACARLYLIGITEKEIAELPLTIGA